MEFEETYLRGSLSDFENDEELKNETNETAEIETDELVESVFGNVVILDKVASYLSLEDLKKCRLVKQLWNTVMCPYLQSKTPIVTFRSNSDLCHFTTFWGSRPKILCTRFDLESLEIRFYLEHYDYEFKFYHCKFYDFFELVAPVATEIRMGLAFLRLKDADPSVIDYFSQLSFPCLERLKIEIFCYSLEDYAVKDLAPTEKILETLVCRSENLNDVDYTYRASANGGDEPRMDSVTRFVEMLRLTNQNRFKRLRIRTDYMDRNTFQILSATGLSLTSLKLDFPTSSFDGNQIRLFLQSQRDTLQVLSIYNIAEYFEFPTMKELTSLEIYDCDPIEPRTINKSSRIDYSQKFPKLRRLKLFDCGNKFVHLAVFLPRWDCDHVRELILRDYSMTESCEIEALHVFRNLRVLSVAAKMDLMRIVYKLHSQLEELTLLMLYEPDNIDAIVTGLSPDECEVISGLSNTAFEKFSLDFNEQEISTSMMSLKKLKKLRFEYVDFSRFTRVSSKFVLSKMESLDIVDFGRPDDYECDSLQGMVDDLRHKSVQFKGIET